MTSRYIVNSLLSEEWDHSGENIMSSPVGACCAVWSPQMWFTGRLQRTGGLEAGGNDPQTVKNLSVGPFTHTTPHHTRPDQTREHRDCLGPANVKGGVFFNRTHTCIRHQQLCSSDSYKRNRTHIVLTFDLPPSLPWNQGKEVVFNFYFTVWSVITWSWGNKDHFHKLVTLYRTNKEADFSR